MGNKHTIAFELDDQRLRALVAQVSGRTTRVIERHETQLSSENSLVKAVQEICSGKRPDRTQVFFAIGDRRISSGSVDRPQRPARDNLALLLEQEARRVGLYSDDEELVIGYREPRSSRWCAEFECAPRSVVDEVQQALRTARMDQAWLMSIESVLAYGFAKRPTPILILEVRHDRARVVLASDGYQRASRKFKLPFTLAAGSEETLDLLLPLVGEIHRSLDLFANMGLPRPEAIQPAGELATMPEIVEQLGEMVEVRVEESVSGSLHLVTDQENPHAWLVPALLLNNSCHEATPCLLEYVPRTKLERALFAGAQVIGLAAMAAGVWLVHTARQEGPEVDRQLARMRVEVAALEERRDEFAAARGPADLENRRALILQDLNREHISVSNLLAVLAKNKPSEAVLTRVTMNRSEGVEVVGIIRARQADQAMDALGRLSACLERVPGLRGQGIDLQKADGSAAGLPFRWTADIVSGGSE